MNVPITVAELIKMLEKFPQDAVIVNENLEYTSVILDMEVSWRSRRRLVKQADNKGSSCRELRRRMSATRR